MVQSPVPMVIGGTQGATRGFTLIELLVVVTIIVVLLALLTPALDSAIRAAEMAQCGATQDAFVASAITYAMANKRTYTQPPLLRGGDNGYQPDLFGQRQNPNLDLRPLFKDYLSPKHYNCPLAPGAVDFSLEGSDPDTFVFINFYYFGGWQWVGALGGRRMDKIGTRLSFLDSRQPLPGGGFKRITSDLMLTERHVTHTNRSDQSTHPDVDGVMQAVVNQNSPFGIIILAGVGLGGGKLTFSEYGNDRNTQPDRGKIDLNYAYTDGSVSRMTDQEVFDERFTSAPAHSHSDHAPDWKIQIPEYR
jgi:prepilin-type N-terminal cleavage/methylation domain-containing protein